MKHTLLTLLIMIGLSGIQPTKAYEDARIPSYDTTYVENGCKYRQIYINNENNREEIYILIIKDMNTDTLIKHLYWKDKL